MANDHFPIRFRPIIRVFVSSTFSDLVHERNALHERVWPVFERHCQLHGFQFQAIDLRWGVPTEAGLDHRTMRICMDELRRSQEISPRPNFLILLGDRYGWQPLPEEISESEFAALTKAATVDQESLKILNEWYRLDSNAIPAVYLLRSRLEAPDGQDYTRAVDGKDTAAWKHVEEVLWSVVNRAFPVTSLADRFDAFPENKIPDDAETPAIVHFQASATEQEIWHGALRVPDAARHIVGYSRRIANLNSFSGNPRLKEFANTDSENHIDRNLQTAMEQLRTRLRGLLDKNFVDVLPHASLEEVVDEENGEHAAGNRRLDLTTVDRQNVTDALCAHVLARMLPIIDQQIQDYKSSPPGNHEAKLSSDMLRDLKRERENHDRFASERAPIGAFVGRSTETARILAYLACDNERPFVVHGISGSGKTALMAFAAREANHPGAIVLQRFLGITKRSSDIRSLLIDLCQTLREHFPVGEEFPVDVRLLEKEFHEQLGHATAERPIYVFLDALDQLDAADQAHSVWWIRSNPLPPHCKFVLSCLSDAEDEMDGKPFAVLQQRGLVTDATSVGLIELTRDEARNLMARWFERADRQLSDSQKAALDSLIDPVDAVACRQPLYLKILFEEVKLWRSFDPPPESIGATVPELLKSLFDRLSSPVTHGPLVAPALAYLVSSRYGLAETELLELLYCDPDYKRALMASSFHAIPAGAKRIPIAIWSRLRYDLAPYLAERGAPGSTVLNFYHRQVRNDVQQRFADAESRSTSHARLAAYFASQDYFLESLEEQRARAIRLPPTPRLVDIRKVYELPWQLLEVAKLLGKDDPQSTHWDAVADLFTDLHFLEAKAEAAE